MRHELLDELVEVTSNSIFLAWEVMVSLPNQCSDLTFSIPPYTYTVQYGLTQDEIDFTTVTVSFTKEGWVDIVCVHVFLVTTATASNLWNDFYLSLFLYVFNVGTCRILGGLASI